MGETGLGRGGGGDGLTYPGDSIRKPKYTPFKIGIGILAAVLLVVVVFVMQRIINANSAAATFKMENSARLQVTDSPTSVDLPDFITPEGIFRSGIPRFVSMDTKIPNRPTTDVTTYELQPGDNLFVIAEKYGLRPETILWGNYAVLRDNLQFLSPGQELNILPTDGVYYQWTEGDDLTSIASFFKVDPQAILDYPGDRFRTDLTKPSRPETTAGAWLIIPRGKCVLKDWGPPAITRSNPAAAAYYGEGYCEKIYEGAIDIGSFI